MCYFVACLHALTLGSLKYLPLSPAVALGLLHTFAVKIPPIRCFGPVVSSQAQQQGEDLKKKSYVHTLRTQPAIFSSLPSTCPVQHQHLYLSCLLTTFHNVYNSHVLEK